MHIHVGIVDAVKIFSVVVVLGFFWRVVASKNSDNALGQAMAFIY